jgi:Secretion system C-terminal sorting domain
LVGAAPDRGAYEANAVPTKDLAESQNTLTVKPNIARDVVYVILDDTKMTPLSIFNSVGQQVLTANAQGEQSLTISTLPAGLYIIRTATGQMGRFIKQ